MYNQSKTKLTEQETLQCLLTASIMLNYTCITPAPPTVLSVYEVMENYKFSLTVLVTYHVAMVTEIWYITHLVKR